jgi:hypothetical protein
MVGSRLASSVSAQGPFTAQIQRALNAFVGQVHTWTALQTFSGGIAGIVAGADTQIQFNDGGAFGGDADFLWNKTTDFLTIGGAVLGNGSASAPSRTWASETTLGWYRIGTNAEGFASSGLVLRLDNSGPIFHAATSLRWGSSGVDSVDTTLCRGGANVIGIGGCTSSFPALKRSGTELLIRLGGDSAYTDLTAKNITANDKLITAGSGTGVTVNTGGLLAHQVYKLTVTSAQFIAAAVTADFTVATLPAKTILNAIYVDETVAFACAAVCTSSTLSFTVGSSAGDNGLIVSQDADAAAAVFGDADAELGTDINRASAIQGGFLGSWTTTTPVTMRLTSGTGNIGDGAVTNLSQGTLVFYLVTERLP